MKAGPGARKAAGLAGDIRRRFLFGRAAAGRNDPMGCPGRPASRLFGSVAMAAFVVLMGPVSSFARDGPAGTPSTNALTIETDFKDWRVICPGTGTSPLKACVMVPMNRAETKTAPVLNLVIEGSRDVPAKAAPLIIFAAPLNSLLPAGIVFQIDGRRGVKVPFRSCHGNGCLAPFRPRQKLLAGFRRGLDMTVASLALDGSTRKRTISLRGFTAAYRYLHQTNLAQSDER